MNPIKLKFLLFAILLSVLGACGGGGSSVVATSGGIGGGGIGGTGIVSSGPITGFGSIFVNGVEYHTNSATVDFDDATGDVSQLKIGMQVKVEASDDNGVFNASKVTFDYSVEGPVTGLTTATDGLSKQFTVLGRTVKVDQTGTVFDSGLSFTTINDTTLVRVSGLIDQNGVLVANFIESAGTFSFNSSEVELKGIIAGLSNTTFSLGSITVDASTATLEGLTNGLVDGAQVEVKGVMTDSTTIKASRVQAEDNEFKGAEGAKIELKGFVSEFVSSASFKVSGQLVDASSATLSPASLVLADGQQVEVEGTLTNGTLVATSVKSEQEDIKIHGSVSAISNSASEFTLSVGTDTVVVDSDLTTLYEDETGMAEPMSFADLSNNDFLEVVATQVGSNVVAAKVKRKTSDDHMVKGPLDSISTSSVTVVGVSFSFDANTEYPGGTGSGNQTAFINSVHSGDKLQVIDKQPVDGIADKVEIDDD